MFQPIRLFVMKNPKNKSDISIISKVVITCQCSDKFLDYDESVHEGCMIMMFMNRFIVTQNFITALTGDKYFIKGVCKIHNRQSSYKVGKEGTK